MQTVYGNDIHDVSNLVTNFTGAAGDSVFSFDLDTAGAGFNAGVTYRVKYQTCTPDGEIDAAGTTYSNNAQIEGWGDAGQGIGTVTNGSWQQSITKSGSVLGGADRNGKIRWSIVVPGDKLGQQNTFTLNETLGDGHQIGTDTISGIEVVEQYGPNPGNVAGLKQNITGDLNAAVATPDNKNFTVDFTFKDTNRTFKPSDWRYIITYYTYVTNTDLPEGGTPYTNSAQINSEVAANGTATVPGRKYAKEGSLNNTAKTLDGVEHSAFTTLNWVVTVPGQNVHGLSEVELIDVLGATHQVCEAGDPSAGVAERLGLNVQVQDQISNGGKTPPTTNLTNQTTASVSGQEVELVIGQPSGQTFDRDYQYVISYTTCTTSGGVDSRDTEYTNAIKGNGVDRTGRAVMNYGGSGTGTGVAKGSVAVSKLIDGTGKALVPAGQLFTVHVKEIFNGATKLEYDLQVPANGTPVSGFNNRGNGWTFELSEPTFPAVPGVAFGAPKFKADPANGVAVNADGTVATVTITPKANVAVELTNTAELGQMTVEKRLEGAAASQVDPDKEYSFTAAVDVAGLTGVPAQPNREFTLKAGETETLMNLPIGARVTVTEAQPADDDLFTWATPVISPSPVTIAAENVATPAAVSVTNSVSRTVGTFSLSKAVTGDQANNPAVPETVTVTATWQQEGETAPTSKPITLPTDGTPVALGEQLLIGTQVTLSETPLVDGSSIAWGAPGWNGEGVTAGADNTAIVTIGRTSGAQVTLTNHAATSEAGLSLLKVLTGDAVADVPADAEFPVTATWVDANDEKQSRDLTINANTPTSLGVSLPAGTVVTITEQTRPEIDTVVWGSISMSGEGVTDNGDGSAQVVVSDQHEDVTLVSVTNEAHWAPGTFSIAKQIDGVLLEDAEVPESVEVIASWYEVEGNALVERTEILVVPTDGSVVDFGQDLPAFTEVTLSEVPLDISDRFAWATATWLGDDHLVVNEDGTATLTIQPAAAHEIGLTNTAVATLGSAELVKTISGSGASAVSKDTTFAVTAEWTDLLGETQSQELKVSANTPAVIEGLPFGTEVTLTEAVAQNPSGARWASATWASEDERVTIDSDARTATFIVVGDTESPIELVLDNKYDEVKLSNTGTTITGVAAAGVLLLGLGGVALLLRRRQIKA